MSYHKRRVRGKIGTTSSKVIVLWYDKDPVIGEKLLCMTGSTYDELHSQYRRLKTCNYWVYYLVTDINPDGFIFLSR